MLNYIPSLISFFLLKRGWGALPTIVRRAGAFSAEVMPCGCLDLLHRSAFLRGTLCGLSATHSLADFRVVCFK